MRTRRPGTNVRNCRWVRAVACALGTAGWSASPSHAQWCRAIWQTGYTDGASFDRPISRFADVALTHGGARQTFGLYAEGVMNITAYFTEPRQLFHWDGSTWEAVPGSITGSVYDVFNVDAPGVPGVPPGVYFTGDMVVRPEPGTTYRNFVRFDGGAWHPATTSPITPIESASVYDDGSGPAMYAVTLPQAGSGISLFTTPVSRYRNNAWEPVGAVMRVQPRSRLVVVSEGAHQGLYLIGLTTITQGSVPTGVARWAGDAWVPLPGAPSDGFVRSAVVHDFGDGRGEALIISGTFTGAGGLPASGVALYRPASGWAIPPASVPSGTLKLIEGANGQRSLHIVPQFTYQSHSRLHRWDASGAMPVGDASPWIADVANVSTAHGPKLVAAGTIVSGPPLTWPRVWRVGALGEDGHWMILANSGRENVDFVGDVDMGSGVERVIEFSPYLTDWSGTLCRIHEGELVPIPSLNQPQTKLSALLRIDSPSGARVYAALRHGRERGFSNTPFGNPSSISLRGVAEYTPQGWVGLGQGLMRNSTPAGANALGVHDDGTGQMLYATGLFTHAGGVPAHGIARWDGATWSAVGEGLPGYGNDLLSISTPDGPRLLVAGAFTPPGNPWPTAIVAEWDGSSWTLLTLDDGFHAGSSLALFDSGNGERPHLITTAGVLYQRDDTGWHMLGSPGQAPWLNSSSGLIKLMVTDEPTADGGTTPVLIAAREARYGGFLHSPFIRWNGRAWSVPFEHVLGATPTASSPVSPFVTQVGDVGARRLLIAGAFGSVNGEPSINIAVLQSCRPLCDGDGNADGRVDMIDLTNVLADYGRFTWWDPISPGDAFLDGRVNFLDLAAVLGNFGAHCPQ